MATIASSHLFSFIAIRTVLPWLRNSRRRQLTEQPFPNDWQAVLQARVRHYRHLAPEQRSRLERFVQVLAAEKDWAGGSGFVVTDEMKVTIAGYAAVMTLGLPEPYYFDRLKTIIIYPAGYIPHASQFDPYPEFIPADPLLGQSWHRGPIILSWAQIGGAKPMPPGNNLVIHEFAHHVDGLNGELDGAPPIVGRQQERDFYRVTQREFERLARETRRGEATLLDHYGASDRAEFFAVASECFFERPQAMKHRHAELYRVLADFYCQDVAIWLPDAA